MPYMVKLLTPEQAAERAKGPARFIVKVNGEPQQKYGILFMDTARNICSGMKPHVEVTIQELTEKEVMNYIMTGWGQGG